MTEILTISGITSIIFLTKYYNKDKGPLPLIINRGVWEDIHSAYYGGRVEVFNPAVVDSIACYYDVNSLYPYASLNQMPGLNCQKVDYKKYKANLNNLFGFFFIVELKRLKLI